MTIENLAPNPSAESGATDPWATSNATLDVTDAEHHGAGSHSFLLEAVEATHSSYMILPRSSQIACAPGDQVAVAAWIKARDTPTKSVSACAFYDADHTWLGTVTQSQVENSDEWQQFTGIATAPDGAAFVVPVIYTAIAPPTAGVGAYVDEIMMVKGPLPFDWPTYHDGDSPGWEWISGGGGVESDPCPEHVPADPAAAADGELDTAPAGIGG